MCPSNYSLTSIREDWKCHLFAKHSLIWIPTVLFTSFFGFSPVPLIRTLVANMISSSPCR